MESSLKTLSFQREILQDLQRKFNEIQKQWANKDHELRDEIESLVSQLRDVNIKNANIKASTQQKYNQEIAELNEQFTNEISRLQSEIFDSVTVEESNNYQLLDDQITSLNFELAQLQNQVFENSEDSEISDETDYEQIYYNIEQEYQDALNKQDEISRTSSEMIQEIYNKQYQDEQEHQQQISDLIHELDALDEDHVNVVNLIEQKMEQNREQSNQQSSKLLKELASINEQINLSQKQHQQEISELQKQFKQLKEDYEIHKFSQNQFEIQINEFEKLKQQIKVDRRNCSLLYGELLHRSRKSTTNSSNQNV